MKPHLPEPGATAVTRRVRVGGMPKAALLAELEREGIELNEAARVLFEDERFSVSP